MKKLYAIVAMVLAFALQSFPVAAEPLYTKQAVERWITKETKAQVNTATARRIINAAFAQAKKHSIDPLLILTTIKTESRFKPSAANPSGAKGLMQVIPRWHRDKIAGRNIMHIETNIEVGTQVLVDCLEKHKQVVAKALRCYSGGASNYEKNLRAGHKAIRSADVLHRFENELPMTTHAKFDQPMQYVQATPDKRPTSGLYALN